MMQDSPVPHVSQVWLRHACYEDLPLLLAWRQNRDVMKYLTQQQGLLYWEKHRDWYTKRQAEYRQDWIIMYSGPWDADHRPIGSIHRIIPRDESPNRLSEVGLYIGEQGLWGSGVGTVAVLEIVRMSQADGLCGLCAHVHKKNQRSQHLFSHCGFTKTKQKGRNKQDVYEIRFGATVQYKSLRDPRTRKGAELSLQPCPG